MGILGIRLSFALYKKCFTWHISRMLNMKQMPFHMNKEKGLLGQLIAECFMINRGYRRAACNYRYQGGEIDLIMMKDGRYSFSEVKTHIISQISENVICETVNNYSVKINRAKITRMRRGIEDYFVKHETSPCGTARLLWIEVFVRRVSYETLPESVSSMLHMKQGVPIEPRRLLEVLGWGRRDYDVRMIDLCLLCPL